MSRARADHRRVSSRLQIVPLASMVAALLCLLLGIGLMGADVRGKLRDLHSANTDNMQWQLAQLEVEFISFELAIAAAAANPGSGEAEIARRFDIFYSRVASFNEGRVFAVLRGNPEIAGQLEMITSFRDQMAARIDRGEGLGPLWSELIPEFNAVHQEIRGLALSSLRGFAMLSDVRRAALADVLSRLAIVLGVLVTCLCAALLLVAGLVRRAMGRSQDILRASARFEAVSATSLDGILVSDVDGNVLNFNAAAEDMFGYSAADVLGRNIADLIVPEHFRDRHENGMARFREVGETRMIGSGRVQLEARRADGSIFPVELSINRTSSPDGTLLVSFMRDVSDRVAAERALRTARDDALAGEQAKANLLAVMSHEMRTPMNGILGTLELLWNTDLTPEQREHLEILESSGNLLLHHVNDVLELSRLDSGQAEMASETFEFPLLLSEVADSLRPVAAKSGNDLIVEIEGSGLANVAGDPLRLRQILLNLAGNATKFTTGGKITITARRLDGGDEVELAVQDTGIGIAPEDQARIFDEFVTIDPNYNRKVEGTGLGLAITRRLVHAMGGQITVESEPGKGATFRFTLPLPPREMGRRAIDNLSDSDLVPELPSLVGLRILIVEDNPINRRIARAMIEPMGCEIVEAVDGAEGVDAAGASRFDVILMDISMPGMDGVEATTRIRKGPSLSSDARIIALTAHAMPEEVTRFKAAGMNDVVVKPISTARLAKALDRRKEMHVDLRAGSAHPLWDPTVCEEFDAVLGADAAQEMRAAFLTDAEQSVPQLVFQSSEETARGEVADRAHALAGSAAVVGAARLHSALVALELAARDGQPMADVCDALALCLAETLDTAPGKGDGQTAFSAA